MRPPRGAREDNPLRVDLGALAMQLAAEDVTSATEAMHLPFAEVLVWSARIEKQRAAIERKLKQKR